MRRKRWRWLQRLTGIHRIHHPRWSFGWRMPIGGWVRFEPYTYTVDFVFREDYGQKKVKPAHWERCAPDSYHNCTATGRG